MPIDKFSYTQFHNSLPGNRGETKKKWEAVGLIMGEYCWLFRIPNYPTIGIMVRSSIGPEKVSADCGEDSIRIAVVRIVQKEQEAVYSYQPTTKVLTNASPLTYTAIGRGVDTYTTRLPGWEKRLEAKIREVAMRVSKIKKPFDDSDAVFFVHKEGPNKGRPFANDKDGNFRWLD